jgi:hypothetical protein
LQWHTFQGSSGNDYTTGIQIDGQGNIYAAGYSYGEWGTPVRAYEGNADSFVVKLNSGGARQWNTFLGSKNFNDAYGIAVDAKGNSYIVGYSKASWGSPLRQYHGELDGFIAKLNGGGARVWNTFLGTSGTEESMAVAVQSNGTAFVTGYSDATWGWPIRAYTNFADAFVAKISSPELWEARHAAGDFDGDGEDEAAVDFGAAGIYLYDSGVWTQLSASNPESLVAADVDGDSIDELLADLGASGLWLWNGGAWSQISANDPE